ncbi:MAG: hypothetical protein ACM34K_15055 [Bacillota bacterium]
MELVPIIELTLSIFAGLFLLALVVSYIIYRIKKNTGEKESKGNNNNNLVMNIAPAGAGGHFSNSYYSQGLDTMAKAPVSYIPAAEYTLMDNYYSAEEEQNPVKKNDSRQENKTQTAKFTILNDIPPVHPAYKSQSAKNYANKFDSYRANDAQAMFK